MANPLTARVGTLFAEADIKVNQIPNQLSVTPTEVVFSAFDDSRHLTATVLDTGGSPMVSTVSWASDDGHCHH